MSVPKKMSYRKPHKKPVRSPSLLPLMIPKDMVRMSIRLGANPDTFSYEKTTLCNRNDIKISNNMVIALRINNSLPVYGQGLQEHP